MFRRAKTVDPRDRVGVQTYSDCHFDSHPDETVLVCATWAHHVDLTIGEVRSSNRRDNLKLAIDLDEPGVMRLHAQLGNWLAHRREERDEESSIRTGSN